MVQKRKEICLYKKRIFLKDGGEPEPILRNTLVLPKKKNI